MAVKTITIDMEAYELLAQKKGKGESFSKVIKRLVQQRGGSAETLLARLKELSLDDEALKGVEQAVASRDADYGSAILVE